ncbi:30S ribosomal protein S12 methylthiotransferase RimO [Absicoccus porci]|jgi:ribosomal protein S12 methylthiotransferase|uniref:30S ribosomal protein S12 methylthiotransferase RimO n=1 Tax=Absicoccus porci TaxID=2486576 RepID=UPI003D8D6A52
MKIGFVSLGCAKNLIDSENMMAMLKSEGHEIVPDPKQAEAIVVNTCGFIASAKQESIQTIFEMAKYKETGLKKLIVCGCLAQRYQEALEQEIPEVDAIIPIRDYDKLADRLRPLLGEGDQSLISKSERVLTGNPWQAYIKISDGCSNHCAYCAIPLIRGEQKSRTIEDIVKEATFLASIGVKELTLIAQDTTKYGLDNYGEYKLGDLIRAIDQIPGFHWIRILYMYPDEIVDDVLDAMKESKKVVPYFDIPTQHASTRMLKRMNRRSSHEEVKAITDKIRKMFPNATLRTTLIVGFPGETQEDFDEMMDFVKEIQWDRMGAFTYSQEEDTPAYDMDGQVPQEIMDERLAQLMQVQEQISFEKNQAKIGSTVEVLVEEQEALTGRYRGRSQADAPDEVDGQVIFTADKDIPMGSFVQVKVTDARDYDLMGVCQE